MPNWATSNYRNHAVSALGQSQEKCNVQTTQAQFQGVQAGEVCVTILAISPHSWGKTLVQVAITNHQHTAIMEDRGLFKMEDHDANIYDPSDLPGGMEYFLGQEQGLFLRQINPGVTVTAWLAFETPGTLDVSHSLLLWRAGMTGKASSMEMTVNRQVPPSHVSPACDGKWHKNVVGEAPDPCTYY
jgi:hypothetical protein